MGTSIHIHPFIDVVQTREENDNPYFVCTLCINEKHKNIFHGVHETAHHLAKIHGIKFTDDCRKDLFHERVRNG